MAVYLIQQCMQCGITRRVAPEQVTIGEPWTCPHCVEFNALLRSDEGQTPEGLRRLADIKAATAQACSQSGTISGVYESIQHTKMASKLNREADAMEERRAILTAGAEPQTGGQVQPAQECATDDPKCGGVGGLPVLGYKMAHEVQSNYDRLQYATDLIMQLPKDHDGRATWLMNYAACKEQDIQQAIRVHPRRYGNRKEVREALNTRPLRESSRAEMEAYIEEQTKKGYQNYYAVHPSNLNRSSLLVEYDAARNWVGDQ